MHGTGSLPEQNNQTSDVKYKAIYRKKHGFGVQNWSLSTNYYIFRKLRGS